MRSSFSMFLLYHAYVYLEFLILACTIYILASKLISAFCGGKLFVAVKVWYPMKEKVGSEFYMYRKKYADIYDTYALFTVPDC